MGAAQEIENAEAIPDAKDLGSVPAVELPDTKDFSSLLAGKGRVRADVGEDDEDIAPVVDDSPAPETPIERAVKQAKKDAEPTDEELEQKIQKPWARLRVAEREKREAKGELNELKSQMQEMKGLLQKMATQGITPQTEDPGSREIDSEIDPAGAILQKMNATNERLERMEAEKQQERDGTIVRDALRSVDLRVAKELNVDPETGELPNSMLLGAINHVAKVLERQTAKKFPDKPESYRKKVAVDLMNAKKLEWAMEGKDPIEGWYEEADDLSFDFDAYEEKLAKTPAKKAAPQAAAKASSDVKARIAAQKEKQASVASIAGVEGAAPKRFDGSTLSRAKSGAEFDAVIEQMQQQGSVKADPFRPGRTPSMSELLQGKGKRVL